MLQDAECEKLDKEKSKFEETESSDSEDSNVIEEYQTRLRDEATYEKERVCSTTVYNSSYLYVVFIGKSICKTTKVE